MSAERMWYVTTVILYQKRTVMEQFSALHGVEQFVTTLPITVMMRNINLMMVFRDICIIPKIREKVRSLALHKRIWYLLELLWWSE